MPSEVMVTEEKSTDTRDSVDEIFDPNPDEVSAETLEAEGAKEEPSEEAAKAEEKPAEDYKKKYEELEKFRGRQANEIGQLRAELAALRQQIKPKDEEKPDPAFLDKFVKDPQAALAAELARRESLKQAEEARISDVARQNVAMIHDTFPDIDDLSGTILDLIKKDTKKEVRKEDLEYSIRHEPHLVIPYAFRAREYIELTSKAKKGKEIVDQMARGSRSTPAVTGSSGQAGAKTRYTTKDLRDMSDDELESALKAATKRG